MNKEWFIFKGTHHLGPYSSAEMKDFFLKGELTLQSLVWREGAEKWESFGKTRELLILVNIEEQKPAPPALPPIPDLDESDSSDLPPPMPTSIMPKALQEKVEALDEPPPLPLDVLLDPSGNKLISKKGESPFSRYWPKILFSILLSLFVFVLAWFFLNEDSSSVQIRVKGVMPVYLERLQEAASAKASTNSLSMALSLDGKTLYATTNRDGEILSIIKMKSVPSRVLGSGEAEIVVRGMIKNRLGQFDRMQLTKGAQFVPGEYKVEFTGRKIHFLNHNFRFLSDISFFKKLNSTFNIETSALIYSGTPREFEKKLMEYNEALTTELLKPYTDKLERLQTFQSLLNKTMEEYLLSLEKMKKPRDIANFESYYIKEISPVIQSLVVAASEISKKTESDQSDTTSSIASYESQIQLGKQMGEMASDMITETGKLKKIGSSEKMELKKKFEARYKMIKSQIDSHITLLQERIQKVSR